MITFLRELWDELRREHPLFDQPTGRRWAPGLGLVPVACWLGVNGWRLQFPAEVLSTAAIGAVALLLAWMGWRHERLSGVEARVAVIAMGAILLLPIAWGSQDQATIACGITLAMAIALCSRLGYFGLGLAATVTAAGLALAVLRYQVPPIGIAGMTWGAGWVYLGPLMGMRSRRMLRDRAARDERERVAREVHDVLAHTLSALSVQIEGARMLLEERPGDPRALEIMDRARRLVAAGLAETGQAVAALRGDVPAGPQALRRLVDDFALESGVVCRFQVGGEAAALAPDASVALYRAAQEALTNIRKHAHATEVTVTLRYVDRRAELIIDDVGRPKPSPASSGYGLTGIRERTELLGGRLDAGPTVDGYRVRLSVPA